MQWPGIGIILTVLLTAVPLLCSNGFADECTVLIEAARRNELKLAKGPVQEEPGKRRFSIMSGKVDVMAITEDQDEGTDFKEGGEEWRSYISPDFDIIVRSGKAGFLINTTPCGAIKSVEEAVSRIKDGTRWKFGYLFVPSDCGCGNIASCKRLHVFTIRGGELIYIGSTAELPDEDGHFYDVAEIGDIGTISRASSALFAVVTREVDGHFIADLDLTWEKNQRGYEAERQTIERLKNQPFEKHFETLLKPFLFRAVLAAYCDRKEELRKVLQEAVLALNKEQFEIVEDVAFRVKPGEVASGYKYGIRDLDSSTIRETIETY